MADNQTTTLIKQQFATLCQQRDAALAISLPLRSQRDTLIQTTMAGIQAQVDALNAQIATAETGLADVMVQIGTIATVLNGQTAAI